MKRIFLNRYFHPDLSATSQMLSDLAFHLAAQGSSVHVITSRQRYDDPAAQLPAVEKIHGVRVHRVWTSRFGRTHLAGRAVDYLSFYGFAALMLLRLARRGDCVIAKTDPPLISIPAAMAARLRGARLVNWVQDVFPEVAERMGVGFARGPLGALLRGLRNRSLRSAVVNVVLGETMARTLRGAGGKGGAGRLEVIHNWADGEAIQPVAPEANPLRAAWNLAGRFVLVYSGNMGRAHEFATILAAADRLRAHAEIVFLFIGGGHYRAWIEREAKTRGLANIRFQPYQPREHLAHSLGVADVHLTCLLPAMEGLVVPSKIYAILASGRPTLHAGDPEGEIAGVLAAGEAGLCVPTGDAAALAARILELAAAPAERGRLGGNARRVFDARFDRRIAFAQWTRLLEEVEKLGMRKED